MKTKRSILKLAVLALVVTFVISCDKDDDPPAAPTVIKVTQAQLDAVTNKLDDFTGGTFAHGGPEGISADSTIRMVYASADLTGTVAPGTIVTKRTYKKGADGKASDLFVTFAMVKREAGYDAANKDWEYLQLPADQAVDYAKNPNGLVPAEGAANRGKLEGCIGCHTKAGGGDYLFVN